MKYSLKMYTGVGVGSELRLVVISLTFLPAGEFSILLTDSDPSACKMLFSSLDIWLLRFVFGFFLVPTLLRGNVYDQFDMSEVWVTTQEHGNQKVPYEV